MLQLSSVFLRALEPEDLELLYTIENDTTVWSVSSERSHYSKFALKQYLASQPANIFQQGELRLVICESLTNKSVGLIDLTNFSPIDRRAEISICLLSTYRGRGYAKDAIVNIEKYAAEGLHGKEIVNRVAEELKLPKREVYDLQIKMKNKSKLQKRRNYISTLRILGHSTTNVNIVMLFESLIKGIVSAILSTFLIVVLSKCILPQDILSVIFYDGGMAYLMFNMLWMIAIEFISTVINLLNMRKYHKERLV